jgi:thiamine-phosphate pyrophosphorylase
MTPRQRAWPREWLMTDERLGENLWPAVGRLPDGAAGIVFRHYATPLAKRRALAIELADMCLRRRLILSVAGDVQLAEAVGAALVHNPRASTCLPVSMSVHSAQEAARAREAAAALVFISPVYATRSHPDRAPLRLENAVELAGMAGVPAIALGGMDRERFAAFPPGAFHGWAGVDAWLG